MRGNDSVSGKWDFPAPESPRPRRTCRRGRLNSGRIPEPRDTGMRNSRYSQNSRLVRLFSLYNQHSPMGKGPKLSVPSGTEAERAQWHRSRACPVGTKSEAERGKLQGAAGCRDYAGFPGHKKRGGAWETARSGRMPRLCRLPGSQRTRRSVGNHSLPLWGRWLPKADG